MSSLTISLLNSVDGSPSNASSVVLQDPAGTFGLRAVGSLDNVLPAGTPVPNVGTGSYQLVVSGLVADTVYEYYFKVEQAGGSDYFYRTAETAGTLDYTGSYTDFDAICKRFGRDNVLKWATINGDDEDGAQDAVETAIVDAEAFINASLSVVYTVPFTDAIPPLVQQIACMLAGLNLYEAKGIIDTDAEGHPQHRFKHLERRVDKMLNAIRRRTLPIAKTGATNIMGVVLDE